jgi:nitrite reductase (NADH) small subunit
MSNLVKVAAVADLESGKCTVVSADGKSIALVNVEGTFYALDNTCPHMGGPLGRGFVDGDILMCPLHGWPFDVKTGESPMMQGLKTGCYECVVEGEDVFVNLEECSH